MSYRLKHYSVPRYMTILIIFSASQLIYWLATNALVYYHFSKAKDELSNGYHALAAHHIDQTIDSFSPDPARCNIAVTAYILTQEVHKIEYTAQLCAKSNFYSPNVILGFVSVLELRNNTQDAINLILKNSQRFNQAPQIFLKLGQLYEKISKLENAKIAYENALQKDIANLQLQLEVIGHLYRLGDWKRIAGIMTIMDTNKIQDPRVLLKLVTALKNMGNESNATPIFERAKQLLRSVSVVEFNNISNEFLHLFPYDKDSAIGSLPIGINPPSKK